MLMKCAHARNTLRGPSASGAAQQQRRKIARRHRCVMSFGVANAELTNHVVRRGVHLR